LDTVKDVFDLIPIRYPRKGNLQCLPRKNARLAIQDATLRICPQETHPWIDDERDSLQVGACYNGDDCYLGPYLGQACHVGLDVNHAKGNPLFAAIDFDTQAYFNSLKMGHNNNRWRGIRRWANGDVWALQSHHLIDLLVPQHAPLETGTRYATTAGVHVGSHEHTHFEFKVGRPRERKAGPSPPGTGGNAGSIAEPIDFDDQSPQAQARPEVLHLDPWIVFWQIFEDRKARRGKIRAIMQPVEPARTGRPVTFSAGGSRAGSANVPLNCFWSFGDGGTAQGRDVTHVFARAGVFPVSLVVDDGTNRARTTQHVAVCGEQLATPVLVLAAPDEPAFRVRPGHALDTYGRPVRGVPHTLSFVARPSCPRSKPRMVALSNIGGGTLPPASPPLIRSLSQNPSGAGFQPAGRSKAHPTESAGRLEACPTCEPDGGSRIDSKSGPGRRWLKVTVDGMGNDQQLRVAVDATELQPGDYGATICVACREATNSPQAFHVRLRVPSDSPPSEVTIDDGDPSFHATPYFWIGHRFCRCPRDRRGHGGFYLTNGSRPVAGEYVRFVPDLQAGRYKVSFTEQTSFLPGTEFDVRVRHGEGDTTVRARPDKSRLIGEFEFDEGADGFVEIRAGGSKGLVIADAVQFRRAT
jgi:hypothetical protein